MASPGKSQAYSKARTTSEAMTNKPPDTAAAPQRVQPADIERIRFSRELAFADDLAARAFPADDRGEVSRELPSAERVRRRLLTTHLKLSENMAPEVFDYARQTASALGLTTPNRFHHQHRATARPRLRYRDHI